MKVFFQKLQESLVARDNYAKNITTSIMGEKKDGKNLMIQNT